MALTAGQRSKGSHHMMISKKLRDHLEKFLESRNIYAIVCWIASHVCFNTVRGSFNSQMT